MLTKNSRSEEGLRAWRLEIKGHERQTTSGIIDNDQQYDQGGHCPSIGLATKMQNKENTTFLSLLRLSFALT